MVRRRSLSFVPIEELEYETKSELASSKFQIIIREMDQVAEAANQIVKLPAVPERYYSINLAFSDQMLHEMKLVTNPDI